MNLGPRDAARLLGGEVSGRASIVCPGPGHDRRDRSLSVRLDPGAPDGFLVHSHAADDWQDCRDHVRHLLGIERERMARRRPTEACRPAPEPRPPDDAGQAHALALWRASVDPRGTLAEAYLKSRKLELDADVAGEVLRWHPGRGAMVALFRNIATDEPQGISRTYLDAKGRKLGRKFLGPVGGAAIKLDADEGVLAGLHIGEGTETCLAARQLGLRPTWALGSCGAIASFPVLDGVECLTLLAENDDASGRAVEACGGRWYAAGRTVLVNRPYVGKDLNDAVRGVA